MNYYRNNEFMFLTRNGMPYSSNEMDALIRRIIEKTILVKELR